MMNGLFTIAETIVAHYGYAGIFLMTLTEQFIQPIPADIFIGLGTGAGLSFRRVLLVVLIAAFIGSLVGYALGKYLGHPVAVWLFGKKRVDQGEVFIRKWGVWGVILAGLTPIPFKLITWFSGIFEMPLRKFILGVFIGRLPRYLIVAFVGQWVFETKFYASHEMGALILGGIQGATEFLPISSSGHLIIAEHFLRLPFRPEALEIFDIFLHGGSLLAILIYFWRDWWTVLKELAQVFTSRRISKDSLLVKLSLGTIPAIIAGLMFAGAIGSNLRQIGTVSFFFIIIATLFLIAEWKGKSARVNHITLKKAVLIGLAQSIALIPGISRSGITISTGLFAGLTREVAARFSFLLGGVAILAANSYALLSIHNWSAVMPNLSFILIGFASSFVVSLLAVSWLIKFLRDNTLRPFAFYLFLVAGLLISFF